MLVEGVKDYAIFMIDMNGKITSWNNGASRILGYSAEEVMGKHYSIFRFDKNKIQKSKDELEIVKKNFTLFLIMGMRGIYVKNKQKFY